MDTRNSCYTYFVIVGNFDPDDISAKLNLIPEKTRRIGDCRPDGTKHDVALCQFGRCDEFDVVVENQMRKTISLLVDKISVLNQIREEYDVEFFLEVVPSIYVDDVTPCLAPSLDIIDFLHATRTKMDIDMYLYNSKDV